MKYLRASAELSDCKRYRFILTREWEQGQGRCCWIMLNPSTADGTVDDPTIRRCVSFSKAWGFKALDVVNLFALRTPSPSVLKKSTDLIGPRNEAEQLFEDVWMRAATSQARTIICAWGRHGRFKLRDRVVLEQLKRFQLWSLGENADGTPKHPLYLPHSTPFVPFARSYEVTRAA